MPDTTSGMTEPIARAVTSTNWCNDITFSQTDQSTLCFNLAKALAVLTSSYSVGTTPFYPCLPTVPRSDHGQVVATLSMSDVTVNRPIPLSLLYNERCRARTEEIYERTISLIVAVLRKCTTAASLDIKSRQ